MAQLNTSSAEACTHVYMARARDLFSDIRFTIAGASYSEHTSLRRLTTLQEYHESKPSRVTMPTSPRI